MRLESKNPDSNYFWVDEYNDEEKVFFEELGFKEVKSNVPVSFGGHPTLQFEGSGLFGLWSDKENYKIVSAVIEKYGECIVWEYQEY